MKAVMIIFNQALTERVREMLDKLSVRGFTQWQDVLGRGTVKGEPHMGSHIWPAMNSAVMAVVDESLARKMMDAVRILNESAEMQGVRAFTWNIEETV